MPILSVPVAGARVASRSSRTRAGSSSGAVSSPAGGKMASPQGHRRTAHTASENVTVAFPGHDTAPVPCAPGGAWNGIATTAYNPGRHGPARRTVFGHHPRAVPGPRAERASGNVAPIVRRPPSSARARAGVEFGSAVTAHSSRCVPPAPRTNPHRRGTRPRPASYRRPVPAGASTSRFPPPYHPTGGRVTPAAAPTARLGSGRRAPVTRGRPRPAYGGGGSNGWAPGCDGPTGVGRPRWRRPNRAASRVPDPDPPGARERAAREPPPEHPQQPAHESGRCAVRAVPRLVVLLGPVPVDEYRRRPRAVGERERDAGGEYDPRVPVRRPPVGGGHGRFRNPHATSPRTVTESASVELTLPRLALGWRWFD